METNVVRHRKHSTFDRKLIAGLILKNNSLSPSPIDERYGNIMTFEDKSVPEEQTVL